MNKLKNTPNNFRKFAALYLYQEVLIYPFNSTQRGYSFMLSTINNIDPSYCALELTPLSQISDEDVMLFFELSPQKVFWSNMGYITKESPVGKIRNLMSSFEYIPSNVVDGLRSKGYALPWMGLSVEDLVSYGWVRLKVKED